MCKILEILKNVWHLLSFICFSLYFNICLFKLYMGSLHTQAWVCVDVASSISVVVCLLMSEENLLIHGSQGLNSYHQSWSQVSLHTESYHHSFCLIYFKQNYLFIPFVKYRLIYIPNIIGFQLRIKISGVIWTETNEKIFPGILWACS